MVEVQFFGLIFRWLRIELLEFIFKCLLVEPLVFVFRRGLFGLLGFDAFELVIIVSGSSIMPHRAWGSMPLRASASRSSSARIAIAAVIPSPTSSHKKPSPVLSTITHIFRRFA